MITQDRSSAGRASSVRFLRRARSLPMAVTGNTVALLTVRFIVSRDCERFKLQSPQRSHSRLQLLVPATCCLASITARSFCQ